MPEKGRVIRVPVITRDMVRRDRETVFVFGDNMERTGLGGQAGQMRGEPNAVGVPTKWRPGRHDRDYFVNADLKNRAVWDAVHAAFDALRAALDAGRNVVIATDGLGTGRAELNLRAPRFLRAIEAAIAGLSKKEDP